MTNLNYMKLVNKYAIILVISYCLAFFLPIIEQNFFPMTSGQLREMGYIRANFPLIFQFFINIVISLFIIRDLMKLRIKNNLIVAVTIVFSFMGVCLLLLLADREKGKANA
ncbi:MAG: hypothetical protein CVU06_04335 [Bacteroidetes bacterium HGW-Bacteroidetes-22]|nr:MAG: hypothetical protein CVU06_04335 [Bacteroidetes bacterium HGW-Bacteroidetes-22]